MREPGQGWRRAEAAGRDAGLPSAVMCTPGPARSHFSLARASSPLARTSSPLALALTSLSGLLPKLTSGHFASMGACAIQQFESGRFLPSPLHLFNKCLLNTDFEPGTMLVQGRERTRHCPGLTELTCWERGNSQPTSTPVSGCTMASSL